MASLLKKCRHGRDSWDSCACSWYIRRRQGGRDVFIRVGSDRSVAERALARHDTVADETLSAALDAWLESKKAAPDAKPNSLGTYPGRIERVRKYFGNVAVRQVRPEHLAAFVDGMLAAGLAPSTVRGAYSVLTGALRHAMRRGVIRSLPVPLDGPGIPKARRRDHDLTLSEVETIIGRLGEPWDQVAEVVLLTGLRWGEVVALRPSDIDGDYVRVRRTRNRYGGDNVPKTLNGVRVIPLSGRALQILEDMALPVEGQYGAAYDALIAAMGDMHRDGMGWHSLRNAHASLLDAAGVSLRDQAARMGHGTDYSMTLSYGLVSQAGSAGALDEARQRAAPSSRPLPEDELAHRRARRKPAP